MVGQRGCEVRPGGVKSVVVVMELGWKLEVLYGGVDEDERLHLQR